MFVLFNRVIVLHVRLASFPTNTEPLKVTSSALANTLNSFHGEEEKIKLFYSTTKMLFIHKLKNSIMKSLKLKQSVGLSMHFNNPTFVRV